MAFLARLFPPRSWCSACGRAFFSDKRRPCRCGATARTFAVGLTDGLTTKDRVL